MKTSNKLLMALGLIILACLAGYNFALKKEYDKGDFRSPYYGMHQIKVSDFTVIENEAANMTGIKIQYGPNYEIWIKPDLKDKLSVNKQGNTLVVKYTGDGNERHSYDDGVIIVCPSVDSVATSAYINKVTGEGTDRYRAYVTTQIIGFRQQAMSVIAAPYTRIAFEQNTISHLNTQVGNATTSGSELEISASNKIAYADFNVWGKNTLTLSGASVARCEANISDSASVTLYNSPLKLFTHP
jgi:hypothetical protein